MMSPITLKGSDFPWDSQSFGLICIKSDFSKFYFKWYYRLSASKQHIFTAGRFKTKKNFAKNVNLKIIFKYIFFKRSSSVYTQCYSEFWKVHLYVSTVRLPVLANLICKTRALLKDSKWEGFKCNSALLHNINAHSFQFCCQDYS